MEVKPGDTVRWSQTHQFKGQARDHYHHAPVIDVDGEFVYVFAGLGLTRRLYLSQIERVYRDGETIDA